MNTAQILGHTSREAMAREHSVMLEKFQEAAGHDWDDVHGDPE